MAKFGINDILNAKTKAAGKQVQTEDYKEIYLSPYEVRHIRQMHSKCSRSTKAYALILEPTWIYCRTNLTRKRGTHIMRAK